MPHELWVVKNNSMTNITPLIGSLSWESDINQLGERLDFEIAFNDNRYFPINPVDLGHLIILKNQKELIRGIVITENKAGRAPIQYTVFDYAFYLNKNKKIYQFNKIKADEAIKKVVTDFGVPLGSIASIPIIINKIYIDMSPAEVIKDILGIVEKTSGTKYRFEMREGRFFVEKQQNLIVKATFELASNLGSNDVTSAISNPNRKRSIENMKNSIQIVNENYSPIVTVKDDSLIKQFGLLQEIALLDKKDIAQANNIAKNILRDLGRIFEENRIEVPGNDDVRAGRIIEIKESVTGMSGQYLINNVEHSLKNGIHLMKLGLGVV